MAQRKTIDPAGHDWRQTLERQPTLDEPREPDAVEWDGDGLPPVGCECEFASLCDTGDDDECTTWEFARVVGYDGPAAVVAIDGGGYAGSSCRADFRPIRSEEEMAAEKEMREACEMLRDARAQGMRRDNEYDTCRALYRAGYRKQGVE